MKIEAKLKNTKKISHHFSMRITDNNCLQATEIVKHEKLVDSAIKNRNLKLHNQISKCFTDMLIFICTSIQCHKILYILYNETSPFEAVVILTYSIYSRLRLENFEADSTGVLVLIIYNQKYYVFQNILTMFLVVAMDWRNHWN